MGLRLKALAGLGLVGTLIMAGLLAWGFSWKADARLWETRAGKWQSKYTVLVKQAGAVLLATKRATDNPKLRWEDTADQVGRLGNSRREWKATSLIQTARANDLGLETAKLKALGAKERAQAQKHIAKRDTVAAKLQTDALTPGERSDCARQLREAEQALDTVFQEGL